MSRIITKGNVGVFKDKLIRPDKIEARSSNISGYGVFAIDTIEEGEIIEECVICDPMGKDYTNYDYSEAISRFRQYSFSEDPHPAIIMGYCGLYNHSLNPNMDIEQDLEYERVVRVIALKRISKNAELYLDYGWDLSE